MKDEKGFTLIELIIAMTILTMIAIPIFKSFVVSTKVNVKSYEKDKANVAVIKKIEEIKKNPYSFMKDHEDKTETRYYTSLFNGHYYYCLENDGRFDDKSFDEYIKNYFKVFPKARGNTTSVEDTKKSCKKTYDNKGSYYDRERIKPLKQNMRNNLSKIKCIVNKCNFKEFYDSNWNVTEEANAVYEAQININRKAENHAIQAYEPETIVDGNDRYYAPFMEQYFALLTKEENEENKGFDKYVFYIFYNYSSEDFKSDLMETYGTTTPKNPTDLKNFLTILYNYQSRDTEGEGNYYDVFRKHEKAKYIKNSNPKQFTMDKVEKEKTSIPVRIDFNNLSNKPLYNVDVYNMADKPMELYIVHSETNNSEVAVKVSKGMVKKTEVYTTKNFSKTAYKIDVKVVRLKDNYNLINYKTEKYISSEEAKDFDFTNK